MAKVKLIPKRPMNHVAAMHVDTQAALRRSSAAIATEAAARLAAHKDEGWTQIVNEGHRTGGRYGHIDYFVSLVDTDKGNGEPAPYIIEATLRILGRSAGLF